MPRDLLSFYVKKRAEKEARKTADRRHLTYSWLRADQASVQLGQLRRSHEITPCVSEHNSEAFDVSMEKAIFFIESIKSMIKAYETYLKKQAGK